MTRTIWLLVACQSILQLVNSTLISITGLAGLAMAPTPTVATLPVTCWVVGGALSSVPVSFLMRRLGRKRALMLGNAVGIVGGSLTTAALAGAGFWLLCVGMLLWGSHNAFGFHYRFTAAESVDKAARSTAISMVLAGGLLGGALGPLISRFTVPMFSTKFLGAYMIVMIVPIVAIALLGNIEIPKRESQATEGPKRPLRVIAAQPKFIVAVLGAAVGWGVMNFLMTSTPLAMKSCGHAYGSVSVVLSSHMVGMFAPSFFTGRLIKRFGVVQIMLTGALLFVVAVLAAGGSDVAEFWILLFLVGVGWNFLYVGGTTLLTETYRPEEQAIAQGVNDFAIFAMMGLASFLSGAAVTGIGWRHASLMVLPLVGVVIVATLWLIIATRSRTT